MRRTCNTRPNAGFTLIETMIVVVVIGIVAGITIPTFMNYLQRQKVRGVRTELMADMAYARSLAIARRTIFQLVIAGNNYQVIQPGPNTIMRQRALPSGVTLATNANPRFFPHGLSDAAIITIDGTWNDNIVTLLPNGTATHD